MVLMFDSSTVFSRRRRLVCSVRRLISVEDDSFFSSCCAISPLNSSMSPFWSLMIPRSRSMVSSFSLSWNDRTPIWRSRSAIFS